MKKLFSTILIVLTVYTISNSQDSKSKVKWGPEQEGSKRGSISGFLGADKNNYFVYGTLKGEDIVIKLDSSLNEISTYTFQEKNPVTNNKYSLKSWAYIDNKLYVLKLHKGPKKEVSLYAEEINKKTMLATGTEKLLRTTETVMPKGITAVTKNELKEIKSGNFSLAISKNRNYIGIFNPVSTNKNDFETFHVTVCDSTFNVLWEKEITVPYTNKLFSIRERDIDNSGNLFFIGDLEKKSDEKVKHEDDYVVHLMGITDQGRSTIDYEIILPKFYISQITYDLLKNKDIAVVGLYQNETGGGADGSFYMLFDSKDKTPKISSIDPFKVDFIGQGRTIKQEEKLKKKEEKNKDIELSDNYDITDLVTDNEGGLIVIGECFTIDKNPYTSHGQTYYNYCYNYYDIMMFSYSSAGKFQWAKKIPKRQASCNDGGKYSSYNLASTGNTLRFLFNDNIKNIDPKKQGDWAFADFKGKDAIVSLVTVDLTNQGSFTREAIIKTSAVSLYIVPLTCDPIDENRMLLFGEKDKVDQFGILYFK